MAVNDIGKYILPMPESWDDARVNTEKHNWQVVRDVLNREVGKYISPEVMQEILSDVRLKYKEEVTTVADLPTTDEENTIRGVFEDNKLYIYDGSQWTPYQTHDPNKINSVENMVNSMGMSITHPPVPMVGAMGDGITNDTAAIKNIVDQMSEGDTLVIPKGEFLVNDLHLTLPDNSHMVCGGKFVVSADAVDYGLRIGELSSTTNRLNVTGLSVVNHATDTEGGIIGLEVLNVYESNIDVRQANGFGDGIKVSGISRGNAYNNIFLGRITDNKRNVALHASDGGWCNENTFYGGRFTWSSNLSTVYGTGYIHVDIEHNPEHLLNNNVFIRPSFEGGNENCRSFVCSGVDNMFLQPRYETAAKMEFTQYGNYNEVRRGYGVIEQNLIDNGTGNIFFGRHGVSYKGAKADGVVKSQVLSSNAYKVYSGRNTSGEETFSVDGNGNVKGRNIVFDNLRTDFTFGAGNADISAPTKLVRLQGTDGQIIGYLPIYPPS